MTFECNFHIVIHVSGLKIISALSYERMHRSIFHLMDDEVTIYNKSNRRTLLQYVAFDRFKRTVKREQWNWKQIKLWTVMCGMKIMTQFKEVGIAVMWYGKMCHLQDIRRWSERVNNSNSGTFEKWKMDLCTRSVYRL